MRTTSCLLVSVIVIMYCNTSGSNVEETFSEETFSRESDNVQTETMGQFVTNDTSDEYLTNTSTADYGVLDEPYLRAKNLDHIPNNDSRAELNQTETLQVKGDNFAASAQTILSALESSEFLEQAVVWPGVGHGKQKYLDDDDPEIETELPEDGDEGDEDDEEDTDDSIYSLAHFRKELYSHVEDKVAEVNGSVLSELINMQKKIQKLEKQVTESDAIQCNLATILRAEISPKRGDIRLLTRDKCVRVVKAGYLQFYTGNDWGFVCDDFFNSASVKVACHQLALTRSDDSPKLPYRRRVSSYQTDPFFDRSWVDMYSIALDDVQCAGDESTVDSCSHSAIGRHDCDMNEIVYLAC